ncbi:hypothetical protein IFT74_15390 [Oxalobacteraceae sp. CFBP 8755]|nr:hypothetical protein [Oxalobacteraceae sp. CFBP 8755]
MTHLHMARKASTIRVYAEPGGYEARRPYLGIIAVDHLTSSLVYVHGAVGKIDRATYEAALNMLRDLGVTTVMYERRGRLKTIELAPLARNE